MATDSTAHDSAYWMAQESEYYVHTFNRQPIVVARGEGGARLGRRRQRIPRLHRRAGGDRPGTLAPRRHRGGAGAGGHAHADVQPLLQRAAAGAGAVAGGEQLHGQGVLHQQRRRSERRRGQARPQVRQAPPQRRAERHHRPQLLPRQDARHDRRDRTAGLPGGMAPPGRRLHQRPLRRPRSHPRRHDRRDLRHHGGGVAGRRRRECPHGGLPEGPCASGATRTTSSSSSTRCRRVWAASARSGATSTSASNRT